MWQIYLVVLITRLDLVAPAVRPPGEDVLGEEVAEVVEVADGDGGPAVDVLAVGAEEQLEAGVDAAGLLHEAVDEAAVEAGVLVRRGVGRALLLQIGAHRGLKKKNLWEIAIRELKW